MSESTDPESENTGNEAAVAACKLGIAGYVHWRADTMQHLDTAIDADPNYALPRLTKAWILHGVRDTTYDRLISELIADCDNCIDPANTREVDLLATLKQARTGCSVAAATMLESRLDKDPTDLLAHRLTQFELFWNGRSSWMCDITERAAPYWNETDSGYGPFMSMRAFANEEAGRHDDAERFGRIAVDIDNEDVWGAHAVAHVLVMRGQMADGVDWLEDLSVNWGHANQLRHHLWWHLSLFLLEQGQHDRIFELLTTEVRNPNSPLIQAAPAATIDIQNFASLLLRLELVNVDVSQHWSVLSEICAGRVNNHANAFSNAHDMMVLAATGQFDKAQELLVSMREYTATTDQTSLITAYRAVGIAVCEAILAHRKGEYAKVLDTLSPVRHDLALLGASHTQRDVFFQLLVDAACREGRADLKDIYLRDISRLGFGSVSDRAAYRTMKVAA